MSDIQTLGHAVGNIGSQIGRHTLCQPVAALRDKASLAQARPDLLSLLRLEFLRHLSSLLSL
ncbi:MAG: hypothetical protein IKW91_02015, partial [Bacteroidaceae bacterium]|nr:hypothetical protein [Bacteroidaceae bacterium]